MSDAGQVPAESSYVPLWTFQDAVERLMDRFSGFDRSDIRQYRAAWRAVEMALRTVGMAHKWSYYDRRLIFHTVAPQSSGTVTFDAETRELTLDGTTWPSWARYGRVVLGQFHYDVESRVSDTVLKLSATSCPSEDIASSSYTLYREAYPLPENFKALTKIFDVEQRLELPVWSPATQHAASVLVWDHPNIPDRVTVRGVNEQYGRLALIFTPPPSGARQYDFLYQAMPRSLRTEKESRGTISVASGEVTGVGTKFTQAHVGCVLRVASGKEPTPVPTGVNDLEGPPLFSSVVASVESETSATIFDTSSTVTDGRYTLSDPLDVEPHAMLQAVLREAEYQFALSTGRHEEISICGSLAKSALVEAIGNDNRTVYADTGTLARHGFRRLPIVTES